MSFNHLILCCLLLLPSIFPESGSFPVSWFFTSSCQSTGALASVLPMNIQGWFPSELTALISLMSKGLLRVFSSTTVQKHQFFKDTQPSLWSNSLDLAYAKMFTLGCFFFFFFFYHIRPEWTCHWCLILDSILTVTITSQGKLDLSCRGSEIRAILPFSSCINLWVEPLTYRKSLALEEYVLRVRGRRQPLIPYKWLSYLYI